MLAFAVLLTGVAWQPALPKTLSIADSGDAWFRCDGKTYQNGNVHDSGQIIIINVDRQTLSEFAWSTGQITRHFATVTEQEISWKEDYVRGARTDTSADTR
jgi:hypothetical protein